MLDLSAVAERGLFSEFDASCFSESTLNAFMKCGKSAWTAARTQLQEFLSADNSTLRDDAGMIFQQGRQCTSSAQKETLTFNDFRFP